MSLKKAYDVLRIEASDEIMPAAVRKGDTVVLHKRIVVKSWQLIVYTKLIKWKPFILHGRKQRWSRKENAIRQINGKFEFLEATRR